MLTKRIIPCLDVDAGRVVKGTSFVSLRDAGDPVELAALYNREGGDELVFLDITASSDSRDTMVDVVQRVSEQVFIPLTVGGGIRSIADTRRMLNAGADKVSVNTAAINNPELIRDGAAQFGSQCIVVAIDAKRVDAKRVDAKRVDHLRGGHCYRGRRAGQQLPLGSVHPRGAQPHRTRRGKVGLAGRGIGRRGDFADQHGRRRSPGRVRR